MTFFGVCCIKLKLTLYLTYAKFVTKVYKCDLNLLDKIAIFFDLLKVHFVYVSYLLRNYFLIN